jgi:hypothetical protein
LISGETVAFKVSAQLMGLFGPNRKLEAILPTKDSPVIRILNAVIELSLNVLAIKSRIPLAAFRAAIVDSCGRR